MTPARRRGAATERPAHRLRAMVTDVDGTLTDAHRRLDPRAVDLIHRLSERRVPVLLATGNVLPITLALHRSLGLHAPIVAENGGLLYYPDHLEDKVFRLADPGLARQAYHHLRRSGLPVRRLFTDRWRESEVALDTRVPLTRVQRALAEFPLKVESTGYAINLMEPGAGKLPALRRALDLIGLRIEDCLVLGDGDNDVDMLAAAGWSVSFPNASRRARAAAKYVTHANFSKGFIEGVKASGLLR